MYRIGYGIDAHRFDESAKLVLGGVKIPYELGLKGHSDADVLVHAICDALLGAMGEKDIGCHFPDTDPDYKNISSIKLLNKVVKMLESKKLKVVNLDTVIICEKPKIAPYVEPIKESLSKALNLNKSEIGVKATTTEGMGNIGAEEGIASTAIVLCKKV